MTTDKMDTIMDDPSFDLQSIHVSFEERRWIYEQRSRLKLDKLVEPIANLHETIRECHQFSLLPTSLSSSSVLAKVTLDHDHLLYYQSLVNGCTDNLIDQFRLHHQQMFQSIFSDLCMDTNYRIFIMIMEGLTFYSSQTVKEYTKLSTYEMRKCLSSFDTYIRSRSTKITDLLSSLPKSSISCYTLVHTNYENNIGLLFQPLPKIHYQLNPTEPFKSIVFLDEYANHIISPEELRFMDYSMQMKNQRHTRSISQATNNPGLLPLFGNKRASFAANASINPFPTTFQVLHSSSIVYPYDNDMVYGQRYPSFWKGTNHTNENSEALFQTIGIDKDSPEFLFVQRLFNKTISETQVNIAVIERIENAHLWEKFSSHRLYMRRKNGAENQNENWLFHGTKSDNHHHIVSHGFNRSYCRDYVLYGRGVYFSRYAGYSCHYSDRQDLSFVFLCRVLVGNYTTGKNDIHVPPTITLPNGKSIQADSTTDQKFPYTIVCTFHDDQNYPEYIITYTDKPNE